MNKLFLLTIDKLILAVIGSAAIGVAISYADLYLFHLLLIMLGIFQFIELKNRKYLLSIEVVNSKYIISLIIILLWYSISMFWTPDVILGLKYLFYFFCGIILSIIIVQFSQSTDSLNKLYKMLSIIIIVELIIALFEAFSTFRWPISSFSQWNTLFGKEQLDFLSLDNPLIYSDFRPPTGFHWNTNNLAITMVIALPFFLCHNKLFIKLIGGLSITLITIFSASRAVFLSLILIYCLYLLIIKKQVVTLSLIWTLVISLFWGMNILQDSQNPRINEIANSLEALQLYISGEVDIGGSIQWRRELIDDGISSLINSNGLGVGAGGSTALQEKLGGVAGRFTSMHNFWIEILVEGGIIIGLLGFIWYGKIIIDLFFYSKNNLSSHLTYYSQALLLSMMGFIPAAVAASSTIYFFPMWIMFGMAISVIKINKSIAN